MWHTAALHRGRWRWGWVSRVVDLDSNCYEHSWDNQITLAYHLLPGSVPMCACLWSSSACALNTRDGPYPTGGLNNADIQIASLKQPSPYAFHFPETGDKILKCSQQAIIPRIPFMYSRNAISLLTCLSTFFKGRGKNNLMLLILFFSRPSNLLLAVPRWLQL